MSIILLPTPHDALRPSPALAMVVRCITALVGGYGAAAGMVTAIGRFLPVARVEATYWAMLSSFALYAAIALWAFAQSSLRRVIIMIWGSAALTIGVVMIAGVRP